MLGKYKTAALLVILVLACAACIWAVPSQVNKLGLSRDGSFTVLTIYGSDQLRYAHQSVEAKEGKPFRIVIDCLASRHGLPQKEYLDLPRSIIKSIRSSQYSVTPEEVVRVVLDLNEESIYRVESDGNALRVFVSDQKTAPFAQWASSKVKSKPLTVATPKAKAVKQTVKKPTPKAPAEKKVVAKATQNKSKRPVPSVAKKPSVVKKQETKAKTVAQKNNDAYRLPSPSDNLLTSPVLATVAKPTAKKIPTVSKTADKKTKTSTPIVATADKKKTVKKTPAVKQQQKKETPTVAVKTQKTKAQPKKKAQPVVAKVDKPAAQPKQVVKSKPVIKKDLAKDTIAKSKMFASINPGQKPDPGITSDKPAVDVHKSVPAKPKQKKEVILASTDNAAKPAAPPVVKTDKVDKIKTSKYRRESAKSAEFKATQVVQFPSRMVIKYKRTNPRDPFESLISVDKKRKGNIDLKHIPNIETLNLVGILEPDAGKGAALMEDLDGIGYILRPGDRVKNGYVAQIDKSAVYFQINEYGWGRTIVKHMEKDN